MSPAGSGRAEFRETPVVTRDRLADRLRVQRRRARWVMPLAGLGLVAVSGVFSTIVGYVVIVVGCALLGDGLGACGGNAGGLRQHRQ
jgi:hypothetical protein